MPGAVSSLIRRRYLKLALLGLLISVGLALQLSGIVDLRQLLGIAQEHSQHWWLIVVLVLLQTLLFSFALAGSLFLWIVAPLYPPPLAALILASGATLGGIGAYLLSSYLTLELRQKIEDSHAYRVLQAKENFFTLFALRVFPAFPHSIINYSAGLLKAPLHHFILATMLGIAIKSYIYARVIHGAGQHLSPQILLDFSVVAPLLTLSLASVLFVFLSQR